MDNGDFRKAAHEFVDWMADYLEGIEDLPVRAQVMPGEIAAKLSPHPPAKADAIEDIFADFKRDVMPGMTHWQHPNFHAYFPGNSSPPSVLAEMLTATLGAQCMLWQTSPAASEMEDVVLNWLKQMIGLKGDHESVIQDSATSATLVALLIAREKATDWRVNKEGFGSETNKLAIYVSAEAHSSVEKTAKIAGYGARYVRKVRADDAFAMDVADLRARIAEDVAKGIIPAAIVGTLGTTGAGGMDPLGAIADVAAESGAWFHVDGAWAGVALILPELRHLSEGLERADSFVLNPHKWLMTNFDLSAFYVKEAGVLEKTLALVPDYLRTDADVIDYQNRAVPLGRRFRALKLWFVIRAYGVEGLQAIIRNHIAMAEGLYEKVAAHPDFEILSPVSLALFSFRYAPSGVDDLDTLNAELLRRLNDSGKIYLTQNRVRGTFAIRFQIGGRLTEQRHIDAAWVLIREVAAGLSAG